MRCLLLTWGVIVPSHQKKLIEKRPGNGEAEKEGGDTFPVRKFFFPVRAIVTSSAD